MVAWVLCWEFNRIFHNQVSCGKSRERSNETKSFPLTKMIIWVSLSLWDPSRIILSQHTCMTKVFLHFAEGEVFLSAIVMSLPVFVVAAEFGDGVCRW